jgi:hypothetical protein
MGWFATGRSLADPLPVQELILRQGDRLSPFAVVIEDQYGVAVNLTDCRCYLTLRPASPWQDGPLVERVELSVDDAAGGVVSYDWQVSQLLAGEPGVYDMLVEVEGPTGTMVVPSGDQASVMVLRPSIAGTHYVHSQNGALERDITGALVTTDQLFLLEDGGYWLLEDGSHWMYEA